MHALLINLYVKFCVDSNGSLCLIIYHQKYLVIWKKRDFRFWWKSKNSEYATANQTFPYDFYINLSHLGLRKALVKSAIFGVKFPILVIWMIWTHDGKGSMVILKVDFYIQKKMSKCNSK